MLGIMPLCQDTLACVTKPVGCPRPNVEVIKYVVLGAHAARHTSRSGAALNKALEAVTGIAQSVF
jgi:hypothetical protein